MRAANLYVDIATEDKKMQKKVCGIRHCTTSHCHSCLPRDIKHCCCCCCGYRFFCLARPWQVREAQLAQYNYILVVGEAESAAETVNVRTRDNVVHGQFHLSDVLTILREERDTRALSSVFGAHHDKRVAGSSADDKGSDDGA
jgi:hypothetical protein